MIPTPTDRLRAIDEARGLYKFATSMGQPLETIDAFRPLAVDFEASASGEMLDSIQALTAKFMHARLTGSRFLSRTERALLRRTHRSVTRFALVEQCHSLWEPWKGESLATGRRVWLLDARTLQRPIKNGTYNHALALARTFASNLPSDRELALLTSADLPPLVPEVRQLATTPWRPSQIGDVEAFVQLATISDPADPINVDLIRAPWIKLISVFLDDIQGIHPTHFMGSSSAFWTHQLAIEKMRSSDIVLTLGSTSQSEAASLWESLDSDESEPEILITSCVSGLSDEQLVSPPNERLRSQVGSNFVVVGNHFPHKNVVLIAASNRLIRENGFPDAQFTFLAALDEQQRNALVDVAESSSGTSENLRFSVNLTSGQLAALVKRASAVVIPSLHEGFSLPVIEALDQGTPVLLSRIPAHLELLADGPWFFDPRDPWDVARAFWEFHEGGESWLERQNAGLQERYRPARMLETVTYVMDAVCTSSDSRSLARRATNSKALLGLESNLVDVGRAQDKEAADPLPQRDREFMASLLSLVNVEPGAEGSSPRTFSITSIQREHDAVVSEFHRSRTWRAGRVVSSPLRFVRWMFRVGQ